MSANWGRKIELSIFGESHGKAIGINIGGLPSGVKLDLEMIKQEMKRRAPGQNQMSTMRQEKDEVDIISGICNGKTTGAPLCGLIYNHDQHSKDYSLLQTHMRPGHSDYAAYIKYHGFNDVRGGGHFSGRITAPIVFAGSIAKQILKQQGIEIVAHIKSIHQINDQSFIHPISKDVITHLKKQSFPLINQEKFSEMEKTIQNAKQHLDSVGGQIECAIVGVKAGIGDPFFYSLESTIASLMFSIPAVKGLSFGSGFEMTQMTGSQSNDSYFYQDQQVMTSSNHNGGIVGGISNGQDIVFTVGIKPTPSIGLKQATINVETKENVDLEIKGRHDPCIVPRAVVVVEAMAALALLDQIGG